MPTKKIVQAFEDSGLMKLVTFDYGKVHKREVAKFYFMQLSLEMDRSSQRWGEWK